MKNLLSAAVRAAFRRRPRRTGLRSRESAGRRLLAEQLEERSLLAAIVMTPQEQLLLELINRARENPLAEAARFGIDLNQGLSSGTISTAAKQPLAPNQALVNAAGGHSQDMLDNDFFSHTNQAGQSPSDRARAAGYPTGVGENIAWGGSTGSIDQNAHVGFRHESLFRSAGHRRNMLSSGYREVGTGVRYGVFTTGGRGYNASMVTEKFGNAGGSYFLTGVAFTDAIVSDGFYTIGEAVTSGTITATGVGGTFSAAVGPSGGYALQVPNGSYTVTFSGLTGSTNVVMVGENEKLDFVVNPNTDPSPPPLPPAPDPPPDPPNQVRIVDDGDSDFQQLGAGWFRGGLAGAYGGDYRFHGSGVGSNRAVWSFTGLDNGNYEVLATWTAHANRASNAPFTIRDGSTVEETVRSNQRIVPDDLSADGRSWERLGIYTVDTGALSVELSDAANGYVVADAIRLVPTDSAPTNPAPDDPPPTDPPPNDPPPNDPPPNDPPPNNPPPNDPPAETRTVDDGEAAYSQFGSGWFRGGLAGARGGDYRFHARGSGSNRAVWSFTNVANGSYEILATWAAHANRASNAPFTIRDGSTLEEVVRRSQRTAPDDLAADGTSWERLGTYTVDSGSLTVELSDQADGYVVADAVRLVPTSSTPNDPPANDPPPNNPPPNPPPNDPPAQSRIVDDGDRGFSQHGGGWIRGGLAGANGGDYRYHAPRSGGTASWSVENLPAGHYEVFATWTAHANRASDARFTVRDGTTLEGVVQANQRTAPNDVTADGQIWERLGAYTVDNGSLNVELTDEANGYVIADAIRVVPTSGGSTPAPDPPPVDRVLDDGQSSYVEFGGGWITGGLAGASGGDYRYHASGSGTHRARWSFDNLASGQYQVFASWVAHANRASNAPFTIRDGSTTETILRANQRVNPDDATVSGQRWERLGTFQIDSGLLSVELSNDANGYVIADAIRIVSV